VSMFLWKLKVAKLREYRDGIAALLEKSGISLAFEKVAGHSGNKFNEMADTLCSKELDKHR
jgi:ribonuclease HI